MYVPCSNGGRIACRVSDKMEMEYLLIARLHQHHVCPIISWIKIDPKILYGGGGPKRENHLTFNGISFETNKTEIFPFQVNLQYKSGFILQLFP